MDMVKATVVFPEGAWDGLSARLFVFTGSEIDYMEKLLGMITIFEADEDALATRAAIMDKIKGKCDQLRVTEMTIERGRGML